jgi:alcohol dehydrogenase class IV
MKRRQVAALLGANDIENVRDSDAGPVLADRIIELMKRLDIPNGLQALGFSSNDIDALVEGALPQHRHDSHTHHRTRTTAHAHTHDRTPSPTLTSMATGC